MKFHEITHSQMIHTKHELISCIVLSQGLNTRKISKVQIQQVFLFTFILQIKSFLQGREQICFFRL